MARAKKSQRQKDLTTSFTAGELDEDRLHALQRFNRRSKFHQLNKTKRTAQDRLAAAEGDALALPVGRVVQVHSVFVEVESEGRTRLCVVRRTLTKALQTHVVVGDRVRFRTIDAASADDPETRIPKCEGVVERIEPRQTILTRADSFKQIKADPIIANAEQMLIVASLLLPRIKWGLIDRMLLAGESGGLAPVLCINKFDLATDVTQVAADEAMRAAEEDESALAHYARLGVRGLRTSVVTGAGIDELREALRGKVTVLAGHSGVGKSSLIAAVQPGLDIRVGAISGFNQKGRHTTTSARLYDLSIGGSVVDTPGIKTFGLWNIDADALEDHFPDVAEGWAPAWRVQSYNRLRRSLASENPDS